MQVHFEHVEKKQTNFNVAVEARKRYESLTEKDNRITGTFLKKLRYIQV